MSNRKSNRNNSNRNGGTEIGKLPSRTIFMSTPHTGKLLSHIVAFDATIKRDINDYTFGRISSRQFAASQENAALFEQELANMVKRLKDKGFRLTTPEDKKEKAQPAKRVRKPAAKTANKPAAKTTAKTAEKPAAPSKVKTDDKPATTAKAPQKLAAAS